MNTYLIKNEDLDKKSNGKNHYSKYGVDYKYNTPGTRIWFNIVHQIARNADPSGYKIMVKDEKEKLQREKDQPKLDRKTKLASELGTSIKRADQ
ncbi:12943_t:CDS:2 [Rhizophagus irregularis]|nr:12943_t:CDS:2 [Rhizophagus irregularis]